MTRTINPCWFLWSSCFEIGGIDYTFSPEAFMNNAPGEKPLSKVLPITIIKNPIITVSYILNGLTEFSYDQIIIKHHYLG